MEDGEFPSAFPHHYLGSLWTAILAAYTVMEQVRNRCKVAGNEPPRCSNKLLEHLDHLRETKDLFDHLEHLDHLDHLRGHHKSRVPHISPLLRDVGYHRFRPQAFRRLIGDSEIRFVVLANFDKRNSPEGTTDSSPGRSPISVNLLGDVFRQNSHKNVILRVCDFIGFT